MTVPPSKCAALDPATCRYHGLVLKMNEALRDEDADAYLYYADRLATREKMTHPEEFFAPEHEPEDIASVKQLDRLIGSSEPGTLPRTYRAEIEYGTIYRNRYRKFAKKQGLQFEEDRTKTGSKFVFTLRTRRDLKVLGNMIDDGQYKLDEMAIQGADQLAALNNR